MQSGDRPARRTVLARLLFLGSIAMGLAGCGGSASTPAGTAADEPPLKLSAYGLFQGNGATQKPAEGVIPYDLTSALFSDYASKYRFVKLPAGKKARYSDTDVFEFPLGTILVKTFAYPHDMRDPAKGERLLETRLLIHTPRGWTGFSYVWNDQQTEATLEIAGKTIPASWIHSDGQRRTNDYLVPDANQCKGCHKTDNKRQLPIGPKARYLNRDFAYSHGTENQLAYWSRMGVLDGAPPLQEAPVSPVWNDPSTGSVAERARTWLDINCAHCHNLEGPARNSGLDLSLAQQIPYRYGVLKSPLAAGGGSGGLRYDIVPGRPDESVLAYRIASTTPDVAMPELGRRMVQDEAVALVRQWIASMPALDAGQ